MSEETLLAFCGDPYCVNNVAINMLNELGWSRKRRKKWLRRQGFTLTRQPDDLDLPELDVCWCGVKNPYYAPVEGTCGGTGMIECHCGGDLCVCHNHGEAECFGCEYCEPHFDDEAEAEEEMDSYYD